MTATTAPPPRRTEPAISKEAPLQQVVADFRRHPTKDVMAIVLGLGAGLSPLFLGFYSDTVWPVAGACVVVALGVIAIRGRLPLPSTWALAGIAALGALGLLALVSALWSPSPDGAVVACARLLSYAAVVMLALRLARRSRRRALLLGALGAGITVAALITVARMLGGGVSPLFVAGRLSAPTGYAGATACAFLLGMWLCVGVAVRPKPLEAAVGAFGAVLLACLVVLTESRSSVPAMALAVVVVLIVQRAARTAWALLVVGGATAVVGPALVRVYAHGAGHVSTANVHTAAAAALGASAVAAVLWGLGTVVTDALRADGRGDALRRASQMGLVTVAVLGVLAVAVAAGPISRGAKKQWRAFTHLDVVSPEKSQGESRLLQGGGPLKEYWRVSLATARDHPLAGAGAGSWQKEWFQQRHYYDQVWQPNSVVFGTIAEQGAVGGGLLVVFVAGVAVAMWRVRRRGGAPPSPSTVAAVGVAVASLSYVTTDWLWVGVPGVTAIGLVAVGTLLAASDRAERADRPRRRGRSVPMPWRVGVGALAVVALAVLARTEVAGVLRNSASASVVADPARAVRRANSSLSVDPQAVSTYYVKAAALARQGRAHQARAALLSALRREPDNFVTWTLLGDLDVRRRDLVSAQGEYRRAAQLDPLDAGSAAGIPADAQAAVPYVGPKPANVGVRPHLVGYQIVKDTSPLELARALGAPGLRASDQVVVGLFGYGVG